MIILVCCFLCGKVVGDFWEKFVVLIEDRGFVDGEVFDEFGCKCYCCCCMVMIYVDLIEKFLKYEFCLGIFF